MATLVSTIFTPAREFSRQGSELIGSSPGMRRALSDVRTVAPTDSAVLIQGETGTGKELIARAVHEHSARRHEPFVTLNCAAIPSGLLESELFGHERGAYTGALNSTVGRFQMAHQGTLFLDEIGDMPLELQPKLLRVLQEQEFEKLGSTRTIHVDVRIVAATNRDLGAMVQERQFRADLFYRLHVFPIALPPLRERSEDIPLLVRHFVEKYSGRMNKQIHSIPEETMEALKRHSWPGNIRELQNFIERAVILSPGQVLCAPLGDLRPDQNRFTDLRTPAAGGAVGARGNCAGAGTYAGTGTHDGARTYAGAGTLREAERAHILDVLRQVNWVVGGNRGAAVRLGLPRTTLLHRMKKLGIAPEEARQNSC